MDFLKRDLQDLISRGIQKWVEYKQPILISHVVSMEFVDPLLFFIEAEQRAEERRIYWSDTKEEFTLVGIGSACSITVTDFSPNRFAQVGEQWNAVLSHAIQSNGKDISRVGPVLMGGGAFDYLQLPAEKWLKFSNAEFNVPQWMVTQDHKESYLTINYLLHGDEEVQNLTERLIKEGEDFLIASQHQCLPTVQTPFTVEQENSDQWRQTVGQAVSSIKEGELEKVVLARELVIHSKSPFAVAQVLRKLQQEQVDTYLFAIAHGGDCLLGASPERIIKRAGENYYSTCLAGSIERGKDPAEDEWFGKQLLADEKNRIEHNIVVRMIGDKLRKYCETLQIPANPVLVKLKNIQHLYTPLIGKARDNTSLLSVLDDLHPTPALGGSPQREAIKKIRELEPFERGWYGGPVGWLDSKGCGEFVVAIRCGLIHQQGTSLFAGCGIVASSDPESEYEETKVKFQPMLSALGGRVSGS